MLSPNQLRVYWVDAKRLRLATLGPREGKSARIVPVPTHVEIASRISTHREAVTRELNRLAKMGVIERRGGTLLVKDVDRLAEMVHHAPDMMASCGCQSKACRCAP